MFESEKRYDEELGKRMQHAIESCWGQNRAFLLEFYMSWLRKKDIIVNLKTEIEKYIKKDCAIT